jgi:hypothetical protein
VSQHCQPRKWLRRRIELQGFVDGFIEKVDHATQYFGRFCLLSQLLEIALHAVAKQMAEID